MNFNHLHYFHVVASEGSLAKAARKLRLSQSTLSTQLRQLEEYFGNPLFDRTGGSLRLNENGRRAFEFTHEMFRVGEKLDELFPGNRPRLLARLDIGIATTVARSFAIDRFVRLFGDRDILTRVRQGDHEYLYHELLSSSLDLFITDTPPDKRFSSSTKHRLLCSPEFVVIAPSKVAAQYQSAFPKSLHLQPFVHYSSLSSYRFAIDHYFRENGVEPNIVAEADDVYLIRDAVAASVGIGVVPRRVIEEEGGKDVTVLGTLDGPFEIYAVYGHKDPTKEVLAALDALADQAPA